MSVVDVLMPVRNASQWVGAAWRSLARQRFRDWRLVAVDDGSDDPSARALVEAARGDHRLHLVRTPPRGVAAALNRGLREVSAPFVARMDADDLCAPGRLAALVEALERHPEWHAVGSRVRLFPHEAVSPAMRRYVAWQNGLVTPDDIARERYVECTVAHATLLVRTRVLVEGGGWWEGPGPEDLDLLLRWHRMGLRVGKVPAVLYLWREHRARETRTSARTAPEAFRAVKARHLSAELALRAQRHVRVFGRGRSLALWVDVLRARGVDAEGVPWRPGNGSPRWEGLGLFCFGAPRARNRIRGELAGYREGVDYLFVA